VFAIGEKRGMLEIVAIRFRTEIHGHLIAAMADVKPAALVPRGQRDNERAEHGIELLGVAMCLEMAAGSVKQEFVGFGRDLAGDAEVLADFSEGVFQVFIPSLGCE
jgi:hypothetical protein